MAKFVGTADIAVVTTVVKMITIKLTRTFIEHFYCVLYTCTSVNC